MGNGSVLEEGRTRAGDAASPCMPKMKPLSPMVPLCAYLLLFVLVVVLSHWGSLTTPHQGEGAWEAHPAPGHE